MAPVTEPAKPTEETNGNDNSKGRGPVRKSAKPHKSERMDLRLTVEAKATIERAAELRGVTMSAFVSGAAYDAAQHTILGHQAVMIELNRADSLRVTESLRNPPEPNEALKNLMRNRIEVPE